ncbi:hypothetical protein BB347_15000 [Natronorubrum daqingense]|uniref:Uncharacterized protein n=2 Tax=Natronorubrum daqingense TaxID=588898 RepID=A0A1P8RHY9_9EURY|nr:hypothetical protein BB347_15000 [Natronorubrum daqingense]
MMNVEYREIASSSDPSDSHPWYDLAVDEEAGTLRIVEEADGGLDAAIPSGEETIGEGSDVDTDSDLIVALTQEGDLITYNTDATEVPPLRAHLAWYDATTDTLEVLEFVEP